MREKEGCEGRFEQPVGYSGIYIIQNIITKQVYVGQSIDITKRKVQHFSKLKRNVHNNSHLQASYNKYGKNAFTFVILEKCNIEYLTAYEQSYLNYYITLGGVYNMDAPTDSPNLGRVVSKQTRDKISKKLKGQKLSEETKKKMSESRKGKKLKPHSEATKTKISNALIGKIVPRDVIDKIALANTGKKRSEESKRKTSETMKGRKYSAERVANSKAGIRLALDKRKAL